jgi:hypothetical protein
MRRDVHLDVGTRIINTKNGKLGRVEEPHYLAKLEFHEICVRYDDGGSDAPDRSEIEYDGNGEFWSALVKHGHVTQAEFQVGDRVYDVRQGMHGTVESRQCREDYVIVRRDDGKGTDLLQWTSLRKLLWGK